MNTIELKHTIEQLFSKSVYANDLMKELNTHYHFTDKLNIFGIYIYAQEGVYHIDSVGDRGEQKKSIVNDLEEVIHHVIWGVTSIVSINIASQKPKENFRKTMFEIRIEILASIGKKFKEDGEKRISEILKNNPL